MSRLLLQSNSFIQAARRFMKKYPQIKEDLSACLKLLAKDAFHLLLKTHKLKGDLDGRWACSVNYELRVIFKFVQYEGSETILLETVGTHDEVY
jgi:mRNA-degrading endonuclease YafQ of YafQ-DinJ toxin-antitoxin module